jgi:hypothetical protein
MSDQKIDHKTEALLAIRFAARDVSANYELQTDEKKSDVIALGQLHATLALVEQQRIANLQRYAEGLWASLAKDEYNIAEVGRLNAQSAQMGAEIRIALGLS